MKSAKNSGYRVIITRDAKLQLAQILRYLRFELKNDQAARNIKMDMKDTRARLSRIASGLKLCDNPRLRELGYRTIHLKRHSYFMLYRIRNDTVFVDAIYHDLQDYENMHK